MRGTLLKTAAASCLQSSCSDKLFNVSQDFGVQNMAEIVSHSGPYTATVIASL